jgi:hypothetical protein
VAEHAKTVGKTPAMAFVLDYLREFPGADYHLVKKAAQAAGVGVPAPVIYGNALRVLKKEADRAAHPDAPPAPRRRRTSVARGVEDLAGLIEQMQAVVAERDRLRDAVDQILEVLRRIPKRIKNRRPPPDVPEASEKDG